MSAAAYRLLGDPKTRWFQALYATRTLQFRLCLLLGDEGKLSRAGTTQHFFSQDYHAEFEALFGQPAIYKDPTVYVNISSKTTPQDAPKKGEKTGLFWSTLPYHRGQNWQSLGDDLRRTIITEKLSKVLRQRYRKGH
jgi:phytoene dehydrogenase-like protein